MNAVKKILVVLIMFSVLSLPVEARKDTDTSYRIIMGNKNSERRIKDLEGEVDYSNLEVEVTENIKRKTAQIYKGPLGSYDNGKWNKIDFSKIRTIELFYPKSNKTISIYRTDEDNGTVISEDVGLIPVSDGLSITSQIKINNVNVGESGLRIFDNANMTCDFTISSSSDEQSNLNILLATYKSDGRLNNISTYSQEIAGGESENIQIVYQFDAEVEHSAKILIWNSLDSMIPVRTEIDFSQDSGINAYYYNADNRLLQIDKANGKSLIFTYDNMGNLLQKAIRE